MGLVLFDGICNLCNASVRFIFARDRKAYFRFASLQSDVARATLQQFGRTIADGGDSVVLVEHGQMFERSEAALRIAAHLTPPWCWARAATIVPAPVRDAAYQFIAKNRYRWFGKRDVCSIPAPEMRSRFLE